MLREGRHEATLYRIQQVRHPAILPRGTSSQRG
jgi:hypothetical protein